MQKYSWSRPDSPFLHLCIRQGPWQRDPSLGFTEVKGTGLLWPQPGILFLLLLRVSRNPWKLNFTCFCVFYPSKRENVPRSQYSTGTWGCKGKPATAPAKSLQLSGASGLGFSQKIPFSPSFSAQLWQLCQLSPSPMAISFSRPSSGVFAFHFGENWGCLGIWFLFTAAGKSHVLAQGQHE